MRKVLKCRNIEGLNRKCPFEWHGRSEDEVVQHAVEHITLWHKPENIPEVLRRARNTICDEETAFVRAANAD